MGKASYLVVALSLTAGGSAALAGASATQIAPGGPIAANFRGSVTYSGTIATTVVSEPSLIARISARAAHQPKPAAQSVSVSEPVRATLEIDGSRVSGTVSGSGAIQSGTLSGSRSGDNCIVSESDGTQWEGRCDAGGFSGTVRFQQNGIATAVTFQMPATAMVDYAKRDQEAAAAAQQQQQQVVMVPPASAPAISTPVRQAAPASPAGPALTRALEVAVRTDSSSWLLFHYDSGSMRNVRTIAPGKLRGDYTYNGNSQGWVEADVYGTRVTCLHFWDRDDCHGVRDSDRDLVGRNDDGALAIRLSAQAWKEYDRIDRSDFRGVFYLTNLHPSGPNRITFFAVDFMAGIDFPPINTREIDCRAVAERESRPMRADGGDVVMVRQVWDGDFKAYEPGTHGYAVAKRLCARAGMRPVADPMMEGWHFLYG